MGGLIYLQNIVRVLDFLDDDRKPWLTIFHTPELAEFVQKLTYPRLELVRIDYAPLKRAFVASLLTRRNHFVDPIWEHGGIDVVFPVQDMPIRTTARAVAWYADLQHRYYPDFFTPGKRLERELRIRFLLRNCRQLIVSSQAVANDFKQFYRIPDQLRMDIYRFVSPVTPGSVEQMDSVRKRYGLNDPFFIVSNQFHKHKNHQVVLKAFGAARRELGEVRLVLTGREPRLANSPYLRELNELKRACGIENRVLCLGAMPRDDQVALMQSAIAVVQPSLFEGWSTVIEDAKSLQAPVIASDLPVHREQLGRAARYFSPHSADELAEHLKRAASTHGGPVVPLYDSLQLRARAAAQSLLDALAWQVTSDGS